MGLISDCEKYFDTKNLYQAIGVGKDAKKEDIQRSFRRLSLKYHPDRFTHLSQHEMKQVTEKFQVLAKINYILTDIEKRSLYDSNGIVLEDSLDSEANWMEYWRCLFPEITITDIDDYLKKYIGSKEELEDLKKIYLQYEGDMDSIFESMIGFEEERTRLMIQKMIDDKEVPAFDKFVLEPKFKKLRREKKIAKEAKEAKKVEKAKKKETSVVDKSLIAAIQSRHKNEFNSLIDRLSAKYGNRMEGDEELDSAKLSKKKKVEKSKKSSRK